VHFSKFGRREFITMLGGAAAWPLAARAQQPATPVIGFLGVTSFDESAGRLRAFRQGLKEAGYVEGENVKVEYRWAEHQVERLPALAADLVRKQVAVIAAGSPSGSTVALAAKASTTTIPIIFAVAEDPVRLGLVSSLARPGGNLTGINTYNAELWAKRLALLHEMLPGAIHIAVLVASTRATLRQIELEPAARAMGLQIRVHTVSTSGEVEAAFASFAGARPDAVLFGGGNISQDHRIQVVQLASRHALPAIYAQRESVEAGGLMSYGTGATEQSRQTGIYVARILKGAKPADLPVLQPTKFELVINLRTAKTLGLMVPRTLLASADEVIE
jgi:putative ABC transport system substrate-binding protein